MSPWVSSFLSISVVSGIPLAVTFLLARQDRAVRKIVPHLTAFGSGALLGAASMQLIPESLASGRHPLAVFFGVVAGYAAFALVERLLASHDHAHAHGLELGAPEQHGHSQGTLLVASSATPGSHSHSAKASAALVPLAFTGDAIHNLVDGMLIAAGFLTDPAFGFLTALAIGLHELPREVGTFGLFVHGGIHPMRAVVYNLVTAAVSFAGAALTLLVGSHIARLGEHILPFAAGSYLYIAVAVGIPALARNRDGTPRMGRAVALTLGFVLMGFSALVR